jgi:dephospho-CoA kinase
LISALRERWGTEIESGGEVDRAAVGRRVFTDPAELSWLERQVHPLVQGEIADWFSTLPADCPVAVVEVPLLFEGEMAHRFDVTVAVVADESLRRERAEARGQVGLEGREERQLSQDEKASRADRVISNDGTTGDLEARLGEMLVELGAELPTDRHV